MRHIEHLMPTATSSCMFASGQILFRISPDRVTGELAAARGGRARVLGLANLDRSGPPEPVDVPRFTHGRARACTGLCRILRFPQL